MPESVTVLVELLDEGTDVWRPVEADPVGPPGVFRLRGPIPDDEVWRFQPGDIVRCEDRQFADNKTGLTAIELVTR
jgi:hypothetical protein